MNEKIFLKNYLLELQNHLMGDDKTIDNLISLKKIIIDNAKKGKKILVFGNGGSAAIASHFTVDLTKNARVRATNFNESNLITCLSNDYGYNQWVSKAIELYMDKGDLVFFISSSGSSKNMINAVKIAKKKKARKIVSFTGFNINNPLKKKSDLTFWVNSHAYNHVENTHQIWLLSLVDLIIGRSKYSANRK
jgi:D-sedoheptulose 7-phosphate isomerase|tara:strand:- start:16 stop:591 length:576 start_codon:yes stop_codon:yes gene_type:complete